MFQRAVYNKVISHAPSFFRFTRVNKFSGDGGKPKEDGPAKTEGLKDKTEWRNDKEPRENGEENIKQLLQDAASFSDAHDKSWATTPYPAGAPTTPELDQPKKPTIDPTEVSILLFPGQGTLKVGAVEKYLKFPGARELFGIANEILGYDLLKICLKGPQEKLDKTIFNQPATVVSSLCALERLREERPIVFETCVGTAGYSVGELSALIFSGAMSVEDGIRLVHVRGTAMQAAAEKQPQGMMSVYCTPKAKVYESCKAAQTWAQDLGVEDPVCSVAIYLYTQSKILGGNNEALDYIQKNSNNLGFTKLTRLPVSGAFHTKLMQPAQKAVLEMLRKIEFEDPRTNVYANCNARPYKNAQAISKNLLKQMVSPVKWEQIIHLLYARPPGLAFPRTIDVGSGGRMKAILKLINAKAANSCIVV